MMFHYTVMKNFACEARPPPLVIKKKRINAESRLTTCENLVNTDHPLATKG